MNDFTCKCYSSEYDAQGREYDWNKGKGRGPRDILHLKCWSVAVFGDRDENHPLYCFSKERKSSWEDERNYWWSVTKEAAFSNQMEKVAKKSCSIDESVGVAE